MTDRFEKSADHQRSKPLVLSELTSEQLNAEIEKGYQDAINGRTSRWMKHFTGSARNMAFQRRNSCKLFLTLR